MDISKWWDCLGHGQRMTAREEYAIGDAIDTLFSVMIDLHLLRIPD